MAKWGNCWTHAFELWFKRGGYIVFRKSKLTWVWHAMWTDSIDGLNVSELQPPKWHIRLLQKYRFFRWFPIQAILFRGRVREGKGEEFKKGH